MIRSLQIAAVLWIIITILFSGVDSIEDGETLERIENIRGERRELNIFEDEYRTFINSYLPEVKDSADLKFSVIAEKDLSLSIGYSEPGENNSTMEISTLKILGIVEFEDLDSNGIFESGEPVSSIYPLSTSFLRSDFILGKNQWNGLEIDGDVYYNYEVIGDYEYRKGYELGFSLGWDWGYLTGSTDQENTTGSGPDPFENISAEELIFELDFAPIGEMREDGIENDVISDYYRVLKLGALAGYQDGYLRGYRTGYSRIDPGEGTTRSETAERRNSSIEVDNSSERQRRRESEVPTQKWPSGIYEKMNVEYIRDGSGLIEIGMEVRDRRDVFSLACRISNDFLFKEGEFLSPGSMEIEIEIKNYPNRREDTRLALIADLQVMSNTDEKITFQENGQTYEESLGFAEDESEIRFASSVFSGFLSWSLNASVRDAEEAVNQEWSESILGNSGKTGRMRFEESGGLFVGYERSISIDHDLKIGFIEILEQNYYEKLESSDDTPDSMDPNVFLFLGTGVIVLIFVAVSWQVRTRR